MCIVALWWEELSIRGPTMALSFVIFLPLDPPASCILCGIGYLVVTQTQVKWSLITMQEPPDTRGGYIVNG